MKIRVKVDAWGTIKVLDVLGIVPHGGYTDEAMQYITKEGYYTPKQVLEIINE